MDRARASRARVRFPEPGATVEISAIFAAMAEGVVLHQADGRITECNPAAHRILGLTRDQLLGRGSIDARWKTVREDGREFPVDALPAMVTLRTGQPQRDVIMGVHRTDGQLIWISISSRPIHDAAGRVTAAVASFSDITERVARQEHIRRAQQAAEAANLAKSEFLANMSHEIRTPMTAILGFTDLLIEDGDISRAPESRVECIRTIRRNGEHLLTLINDILDLSKIEAGKMTVECMPTSPMGVLEEVISLLGVRAAGKNIRLESLYHTDLPDAIRSDPVRLRQILVNLVGNAIKFTEFGEVRVDVRLEPDASGTGTIRVDVRDTGVGMTTEQLARLFEAFTQADTSITRKFGGTGLGLRISRRLAQMLGGDITVTSTPGEGSTFTLRIPSGPLEGVRMIAPSARDNLRKVLEDPPRAELDAGTPGILAGARILLAEDGPDNQRLIAFHLRKSGAALTIADNGRIAIEHFTTDGTLLGDLLDPPPFDLILMDMQMPELDGYSATRWLRQKGARLPIIALTAHAMSGDRERCTQAGCDDYATKPIDKTQLITTCLAALNRFSPEPQTIP
jgi:PAS domain S-box-containing protein